MPEIEVQHIVSFSSADKNNPAENLLKLDGSHKWKCAAPGEKSVSCILQFSKCSQIHSIDIGNEGSAFVEILVGKSAATTDKDFEVLLVASSFMSPLDSRNGTNRTSVRMFGPDKLNKVTADKKWDRVKIICSQPFTKTTQYGLSFVKFHSPSDQKDNETKTKKLGAFSLKPDSDEDADDIQVGSLFANRGKAETVPTPSPTGAAAIRAAGRLAQGHIKTTPPGKASPAAPAKRPAASPPPAQVQKKTKTGAANNMSDSDTEEEEPVVKPALRKQSTSLSSTSSNTKRGDDGDAASALKRSKTLPATKSADKEFGRLMESVVFVLSGFQNPFRGELRDKAMEMGAKYRPDWGRGCTHLICAFQNTPKYQQVSGKGKIVTKSWITDCHKMKKLLPWRKYRLGDAESPDESSEDEEEYKPASKPKVTPQRKPTQEQPEQKPSENPKKNSPGTSRSTLPQKGVSFGSGSEPDESEEDTDDELRKAAERNKQKKKLEEKTKTPDQAKAGADKEADPYDVATDEEQEDAACKDDGGSDSGLPDLPEFFSDKHFFFYGDFESAERRLLTRYVAAYNGEEEDYMSKKVNFVVTAQKWDDNFEEALAENPTLVFVKPKWIFACHDKSKLLPYQPYIVVPH